MYSFYSLFYIIHCFHAAKPYLMLTSFSSFSRVVGQPEIYRSMLMNVFLFFPLGLSLPSVFRKESSVLKPILITVLFGLFLSVCIETIQYLLSIGLCETDDIICNTLGTAIGCCAHPLALLWSKIKSVKKINNRA